MDAHHDTGLSRWLATPAAASDLPDLARQWRDWECTVVLAPAAAPDPGFGAHLRRSFLGALAPGASPEARAGKPCPWEPPCALDLFLREQLRTGGDGLPKPYVLFWQRDRQALAVTLRLFGTACDWGPAAAEALVAGLTGILPWTKALAGQRVPPAPVFRSIATPDLPDAPEGPLTLRLLSPMDDEGANPTAGGDAAGRLLSRAVRRVDALARWQGLALAPQATRDLTDAARAVRARALRLTRALRESPNRHGQARTTSTVSGEIDLPPLPPELRLLLSLACRCHLGRHTNEGLGVLEVSPAASLTA